jgi:DNA-binding transcriptional MerR regulator
VAVINMAFTTTEVMDKSGATYRQLDYWAREKWIDMGPNQGTGNARMWTHRQMLVARMVVTLIKAGFEVRKAFEITGIIMADHIRQEHRMKIDLAPGVILQVDNHRMLGVKAKASTT